MFFLEIIMQSDKIATLVKSANVNVESYWPSLFAKLAEKRNVGDLIMNIGAGGGGGAAPVAISSSAPAAAPAVEEKKVKLMVLFFGVEVLKLSVLFLL
jgi:large subunit ribosomal protein LP1